jgi:hypothetical protein
MKKRKPAFKKFWQLINLDSDKFDSRFSHVDSVGSPVQLSHITDRGFTASVCNRVRNLIFYITMKNDPNYLIKKIDFYPYAEHAGDTQSVFVEVNVQGPYSIYVKYHEVNYHAA